MRLTGGAGLGCRLLAAGGANRPWDGEAVHDDGTRTRAVVLVTGADVGFQACGKNSRVQGETNLRRWHASVREDVLGKTSQVVRVVQLDGCTHFRGDSAITDGDCTVFGGRLQQHGRCRGPAVWQNNECCNGRGFRRGQVNEAHQVGRQGTQALAGAPGSDQAIGSITLLTGQTNGFVRADESAVHCQKNAALREKLDGRGCWIGHSISDKSGSRKLDCFFGNSLIALLKGEFRIADLTFNFSRVVQVTLLTKLLS